MSSAEKKLRYTVNRIKSHFDRQDKKSGEIAEDMRTSSQHLVDLLHRAQELRLTIKVDVITDKKTPKRTEDSAADRVKNRDISPVKIDDGPMSLTSFGVIAEPLLMAPEKCIGDALVDKEGAGAPKPHLPPVKVRMLSSAAGGFLFPTVYFLELR